MILILLWFTTLASGHLTHFHPKTLHLIDNKNNNFLFRSGSPLTHHLTHFDIDAITKEMEKKVIERNLTWPKYYKILDISLLEKNKTDDAYVLDIESKFFSKNYKLGVFFNWPIYGNMWSPNDISNSTQRQKLAKTFEKWSPDDLPTLIEFLRYFLCKQYDESILILIHCMQGVDRTGEVSGAYEMKYFNKTYSQVVEQDTRYNNNEPAPKQDNRNALLWYKDYLKFL